jgi:hypothetical protein
MKRRIQIDPTNGILASWYSSLDQAIPSPQVYLRSFTTLGKNLGDRAVYFDYNIIIRNIDIKQLYHVVSGEQV